jgi:dTDP-4-dehydrorhamnose 3,5-epimerase
MLIEEVGVSGVFLIHPQRRADERGYFARMVCEQTLAERGLVGHVSQINTGFSPRKGTLRGMHFQRSPHAEVKIVRCLRGSVFDVVVDLRPGSRSYLRWFGTTLSAENSLLLYAPEGTAHGYLTLEPDTELMYMTSKPYAPEAASGVRHDDPAFGIDWPAEITLISQADQTWANFR